MAARDPLDIQREAEALFLESVTNFHGYLDVNQHPNERSKLVYDCIRHFNERKENILLSDNFLEESNRLRQLFPEKKSLITVYDYADRSVLKDLHLKKALTAWNQDFPSGHITKTTRSMLTDDEKAGESLISQKTISQCGLFALIESIKSQFPDLPVPDIKVLQGILERPEFQRELAYLKKEANENVDNNYSADLLYWVLKTWGKDIDPDLNLRLGYIVDGRVPRFVYPNDAEEPNVSILWIHNRTDERHWEGLEAKPEAELEEPPKIQPEGNPETKPEVNTEKKLETEPAMPPKAQSKAQPEIDTEAVHTEAINTKANPEAEPEAAKPEVRPEKQLEAQAEEKDAPKEAEVEEPAEALKEETPAAEEQKTEVLTEVAAPPTAKPAVEAPKEDFKEATIEAEPKAEETSSPAPEAEVKTEAPKETPTAKPEAKAEEVEVPKVEAEAPKEPESAPAPETKPEIQPEANSVTRAINSSTDLHTELGWPRQIGENEIKFRKDPTCRFIFLEKVSATSDIININEQLLLEILAYHQVSPCYLSLISSFRSQYLSEAADLFFDGFRSRKSFTSANTPIDKLGRSGYQFHLAFKLKAVSKPSEEGVIKHKRAEKIDEKEVPETADDSKAKDQPGIAGPVKAESEEKGSAKGEPAIKELATEGLAKGGSVTAGSVKAKSVKAKSVKAGSVKVGSVKEGSGATNSQPEELAEPDWSVYEAAVYQCFDLKQGRVVWIITAPQRKVLESPSSSPDPWGNIVDVHKKWPRKTQSRPEDCLKASFSVLEWLGEWSLSEFGFYTALLDEKLRKLTERYFISEKPKEVDEIQLKIMNNNMERLANCIVMLKNNIKVFSAINGFFTDRLENGSRSNNIYKCLNMCESDISQFDDRMAEIQEVAEAIVTRAELLMDRALRREAGIQRLLQNRNDETVRTLTKQTQTDSTRMRIFATITLILLPVTVVSTVFATDIVHFQEPTPVILNGTGTSESSKAKDSSDINTVHGKFSKWALIWWVICSIIATSIVLIGSYLFQWWTGSEFDNLAGEPGSTRKPPTHHNKKNTPSYDKHASESNTFSESTATDLSRGLLGLMKRRPKRQGPDGDASSNKATRETSTHDINHSTSNSSKTKVDPSIKANTNTNTANGKTNSDEKDSKAGSEGPTAGTQKPNPEHSTSESANFQAAPDLEKGQVNAKTLKFLDKLQAFAGSVMRTHKE